MSVYKRGNIWWVKFKHAGREIRRSTGSRSRRRAQKLEVKWKSELHAQKFDGATESRSFEDLATMFLNDYCRMLRPSSRRRYAVSIAAMRPHFQGLNISAIDKAAIMEFVRARSAVVKTARRDIACLSSMFESAIDRGWMEANPVKAIRKRTIRDVAPRTRYLSHDEYSRLIGACRGDLKAMIRFAVHTGLRLGEQCALRWEHVDMKGRRVRVVGTKGGTERTVPLDGLAVRILRQIKVRHISGYVFCKADGTPYGKRTRGLAGAAKRAGIKDLRWHDLRRTYGSWQLQRGVPIEVVSKILGHASIAITERHYAFLNLSAIEKLRQGGTKRGTGIGD